MFLSFWKKKKTNKSSMPVVCMSLKLKKINRLVGD